MRIYPGTRLQKHAIAEGVISANDDLLKPKYYISANFEPGNLKEQAKATNKTWVFPDEDLSVGIKYMRRKNMKGPLWEHLIQRF